MQSGNLRTRETRNLAAREAQQLGVTASTCLVPGAYLGMLTGGHTGLSYVTSASSEHGRISYRAAQVFPKQGFHQPQQRRTVSRAKGREWREACVLSILKGLACSLQLICACRDSLLSSLAQATNAEGLWSLYLPRPFSSQSLQMLFPSPVHSWRLSFNAVSTERSFLGTTECLSWLSNWL